MKKTTLKHWQSFAKEMGAQEIATYAEEAETIMYNACELMQHFTQMFKMLAEVPDDPFFEDEAMMRTRLECIEDATKRLRGYLDCVKLWEGGDD